MSVFEPLATQSQLPLLRRQRQQTITGARLWRLFTLVLLIIVAVAMLLPFVWLVSSSLKTQANVFQYPPQWIPNPAQFQNYVDALTYKPFGVYLKNTLIIATLNVVAVVFTSSLCAYGFARIRFRGRDFWFGIVIATILLPSVVLLVPQFIIFTHLGWVDTFLPLVVPLFFGGGAFNIFLLRQFFRTIPEELADAARIDGCSEFGIYWRIMLPLSRPALITVGILTFLNSWNDLLNPIIYLRTPDNFTLAIGLALFRSVLNTRWELLMAASTATILPVIVLFFFAQRYFIRGIVMSGMR
ncbi:MAG: carbohydrate ABC transporter permease [Aggregatilineales bacterium]